MRSRLNLTDSERRAVILPSDSAGIELGRPTLAVWAVLAALSLILGLIWRIVGKAPAVPAVLNAAGLALWLTALWLAPAWDRLLRRQRRHLQPRRDPWSWRLANSSHLLLASLIISLAPAALLLGFDLGSTVAQGSLISEVAEKYLTLSTGLWLILGLLMIGPIVVIVSTLLLHLAHLALGWRWALASWLAAAVACNAPLVVGNVPPLAMPRGAIQVPFTIGQYASWMATSVANSRLEQVYWHELIGRLLIPPVLVLLAILIVATLIQEPARGLMTRLDAVWLAVLASVVAVAGRAAWHGWQWASDPSHSYPGNWMNLIYTGLAVAWAVWGLLLLRQDSERPSAWNVLGWLLFAASAWTCLTLAHRVADQASMAMLLRAGGVALPMLVAGFAAIYRVYDIKWLRSDAARIVAVILLMAGLLLPLPLPGGQVPLTYWILSLLVENLNIDRIPGVGLYVLTGLVVFCALIWPFSWRLKAGNTTRVTTG